MNFDRLLRPNKLVVTQLDETYGPQLAWLGSAMQLMVDTQNYVNVDPRMVTKRREDEARDLRAYQVTSIFINLLNDATDCLNNALRLLVFGSHADSFALLRGAFEACCYAEYLGFNKENVTSYLELEAAINRSPEKNIGGLLEKGGLQISTVMRWLEGIDDAPRRGFYARLCNYGAHASPARVGLRLVPPDREIWTRQCVSDLMAVTRYAVEMPFERLPEFFREKQCLVDRCASAEKEFHAVVIT